MAPRKGRSPLAANVTQQSIEQATATLAELPEKAKTAYSLREAVKALQGTINSVLERGYSHQEVAEMLGEKGIRISPASLKSYLAANSREAAAPKQRRAYRKSKGTQEAPVALEEAPQAVEETVAPPVLEPEPQQESTPEPAPKKTRGPRTANKSKTSAPAKGRKATSTGIGTRRKKAGAAS